MCALPANYKSAPLAEYVSVPVAEASEVNWTPENIKTEAIKQAQSHDLNIKKFVDTMSCESEGFRDPAIQSGYYKNGVRETSYGVAQFNFPTNELTYDEAINPSIALRKAAEAWQRGEMHRWTCYRNLKGQAP